MPQYTYGLTRLLGHGHAFTQREVRPSPAAGAGFTYTNSGRYWELVDSLSFVIVTASDAANRAVTLTVKDGDGVALATVPAAAALTASKTGVYTFLADYSAVTGATDGPFLAPFPPIFLQPSFSYTIGIGAVQAGDQVSAIRQTMQRFVTGSEGYLLGVLDTADAPAALLARYAAVES